MGDKIKTILITSGVIASGIGGIAWLYSDNNKPTTENSGSSSSNTSSQNNTVDSIDKDCGDFGSHQEAQEYFESQGGSSSNNVDRLDRDSDGLACEAN